jgi:hypothetical protein
MGDRDGRTMIYGANTNAGRRHCGSHQASNDFWPLFVPIKRNGWACGRGFESHAGARGSVFGTSPRVACRLQAHLAAASAADADDDFGTPLAGRNPTPRAGSATHEAYFRRPDQGSLSERAP